MDKLLIVGIETLAGSNLALAFEGHFAVSGISRDGALQIDGIESSLVRRDDLAALERQVDALAPRWILHCPLSAAASWDLEANATSASDESAAALLLTRWASAHDARCTVLSSDSVFAGPRMFHEEDSPATAAGAWPDAARKLEQALSGSSALIVRSHVYGWSPSQDSFAEIVWSACVDRRPVSVDGRRHATPLLISDLAEFLEKAYYLALDGLWHVAGAERSSPFRFACELATALGLPVPRPLTSGQDVAALDQAETSLCCRRARHTLEMATPLLGEGLQRFAEQAENGWRDRLRGEAWEATIGPKFAV